DVVRTLDSTLGTELTRTAPERWGISILELFYRRRRLLIIDKLAGATSEELQTLVDIIGHLHDANGHSRIVLIDRNFSSGLDELVRHQHLHLEGLSRTELPLLIERRAPAAVRPMAIQHTEEIYEATAGRPLNVRLILGLLLDFPWPELAALL